MNAITYSVRIFLATVCILVAGCEAGPHTLKSPPGNYVDLVANLGAKNTADFDDIYRALRATSIHVGRRAMSLGTEQITVSASDFDQAKAFVTRLIVKKSLTVRLYGSPNTATSPQASLLEVWVHGVKVREEPFRL